MELVEERNVVEADDRKILRTAQAHLGHHVVAAESQQIVAREDRREARTSALQELAEDPRPLGFDERFGESNQLSIGL